MENQELDRKDLKIRALQQKISEQDDRIVELRIDLTILNSQNQRLQQSVNELSEALQRNSESEHSDEDKEPGEVVQGEVQEVTDDSD